MAVDNLSPADANVTVLQLRLGRLLLDTCVVPPPLPAPGASPLEMETSCS